jgi:hypothetical protein
MHAAAAHAAATQALCTRIAARRTGRLVGRLIASSRLNAGSTPSVWHNSIEKRRRNHCVADYHHREPLP